MVLPTAGQWLRVVESPWVEFVPGQPGYQVMEYGRPLLLVHPYYMEVFRAMDRDLPPDPDFPRDAAPPVDPAR